MMRYLPWILAILYWLLLVRLSRRAEAGREGLASGEVSSGPGTAWVGQGQGLGPADGASQENLHKLPFFDKQPAWFQKLAVFDFLGWALWTWRQERKGGGLDPDLRTAMAILTNEKEADQALELWMVQGSRDLLLIGAFLPAAFLVTPGLGILTLALLCLRYWAASYLIKKEARERKEALIWSLPEVLTKLVLSLQAGSLPDQAWKETAASGHGPLYEEMEGVLEAGSEGLSGERAYWSFGRRYGLENLNQLGLLYSQSLRTGGVELTRGLDRIRKEEIEERKRSMKVEADVASQRMLFPGILVFFAIILLLIVPLMSHAFDL